MRFVKMHGAGNDYIFIDGRGRERDWAAMAVVVSDRHFGIGADGLIVALSSAAADIGMRMFNSDGSEGDMCGNGIRCFVKFVLDNDITGLPDGKKLQVETSSGVCTVEPIWDGEQFVRARVWMGRPGLRPEQIPVDLTQRITNPDISVTHTLQSEMDVIVRRASARDEMVMDLPLVLDGYELLVTGVSMGNPHAIAFLETPVADFPLSRIGPLVEHHPLFPRRVNFEVVNLVDDSHLNARVWERGSGETLACGTGACGIAVAARLHGFTGDTVDIKLPGGVLVVDWDGVGEVFLEGPVQDVFEGEWPE